MIVVPPASFLMNCNFLIDAGCLHLKAIFSEMDELTNVGTNVKLFKMHQVNVMKNHVKLKEYVRR